MAQGDFEKYLAGIPISAVAEELAGDPVASPRGAAELSAEEIAGDEAIDLKALTVQPGWPVFMRDVDEYLRQAEADAIHLSQQDPLSKKDEIANAWAYVACLKTFRVMFFAQIANKILRAEV